MRVLMAFLALAASLAHAQLNPSDFHYCNVDPSVYPIPTIDPPGLELTQLQVFIRHGDRLRCSTGICWPGDDTSYTCDLDVALASSAGQGDSASVGRLYRKQYMEDRNALLGTCGKGELTARGYAQHATNAGLLRAAYGDFLPDLNDAAAAGAFFLRSTDVPRTIQSGQALIDALFPPPASPAGPVQQRPWFTVDPGYDSIIQPGSVCPYAVGALTAMDDDPDFLEQYDSIVAPVVAALAEAYDCDPAAGECDLDPGFATDCAYAHACDGCATTQKKKKKKEKKKKIKHTHTPRTLLAETASMPNVTGTCVWLCVVRFATPSGLNASLARMAEGAMAWQLGYSMAYNNGSGLRANVGLLLSDVVSTLATALPTAQPAAMPADQPKARSAARPKASTAWATASEPLRFALFSGHDTGPMVGTYFMLHALSCGLLRVRERRLSRMI